MFLFYLQKIINYYSQINGNSESYLGISLYNIIHPWPKTEHFNRRAFQLGKVAFIFHLKFSEEKLKLRFFRHGGWHQFQREVLLGQICLPIDKSSHSSEKPNIPHQPGAPHSHSYFLEGYKTSENEPPQSSLRGVRGLQSG